MSIYRANPDWRGALAGFALLAFVTVSPGQISVETIGGGVRSECGSSAGFVGGNTYTAAQFNQPYASALDSQGNLWIADLKNSDVEQVSQAGNRASSITYPYYAGSNHHPFPGVVGVALDSGNNLYVLTATNLSVYQNVVDSFPDLNLVLPLSLSMFSPGPATGIAVANDGKTNIYISFTNSLGGTIIRIPQPYSGAYSIVVNDYAFAPAGLTVRQDGRLGVTDTLFDRIYVVTTNTGSTPLWITGGPGPGFVNGAAGAARFNQPHGIAASGDGRMVVCDTLNNYVRVIDTNFNTTTLYGTPSNVWTGTCCSCSPALYAGWVDGTAGNTTTSASGREPVSVTISSNGTLFVTELYYNLIRSVSGSGLTPVTSINSSSSSTNLPIVITEAATPVSGTIETLNANVDPNGSAATVFYYYGILGISTNTAGPVLLSDPTILNVTNSVPITVSNLLPNTQYYYLAVANNAGGTTYGAERNFFTTTVVTSVVTLSPNSGYFPECQTITVTSPVSNIYYTENGSTPTTNSDQVVITQTNGSGLFIGTFQWCNPYEDLSALQIITVSGGVASEVQTGGSLQTNQLGFVRSPSAGIGSTAFVPIVLDLQSNYQVESLLFRVEVTPNGSAPVIPSLTLLPVSSNDYVQFVGGNAANSPVTFSTTPYTTSSNGQGLVVATESENTGLDIQNFGVVGLLEFQIPVSASTNHSYSLNILYPSGTFGGYTDSIPMSAMSIQTLKVADLPYLAGGVEPSYGYDAGEFGNGVLEDSDFNAILFASMGIRVPPVNSDAFNAMDVYPQTPFQNGDGLIQYQDWNTVMMRAVGLDLPNWIRYWTNGGELFGEPTNAPAGLPGNPAVPTAAAAQMEPAGSPPGLVWHCPASVGAGTVTNLTPGQTCSLPVYANILPGYSLSGFQFRAIVSPNGNAPPVGQVTYNPAGAAAGKASLMSFSGLSENDILNAWPLKSFTPPLEHSNYIGTISFQIPATAQAGQSYAVHFIGVDGAPDTNTDYAMESFPGFAWVRSSALQPASITSDEWKAHFFGSLSSSLAGDNVDADGDGALNWQEYVAGTDPTNPASVLQFGSAGLSTNGVSGVALNWLTAPGKTYVLESIPVLGQGSWTSISTNTGDGYPYQFIQTKYNDNAHFYRIVLQP